MPEEMNPNRRIVSCRDFLTMLSGVDWDGKLLPDNLVVDDSLNMVRHRRLRSLPENLTVRGFLNLNCLRSIDTLPKELIIGGHLSLDFTTIKELPEDIIIGGNLSLIDVDVTSLPDNLTVGGVLGISGTKISDLPRNLTVGSDIVAFRTNINRIPEDLVIGNTFYTPNKYFRTPRNLRPQKYMTWKNNKYIRIYGFLYDIISICNNVITIGKLSRESDNDVVFRMSIDQNGNFHCLNGKMLRRRRGV